MTMMATYVLDDRNQDATVYVGNLDEKVTETILWELFLQGGPVVSVHLPKDRVSYLHQGFGFVEFVCEEDADYCIKIMNMIKLFGKPIRVNKIMRDYEAGTSKGFAFVNYASFEASDAAIEAMNGQFLCNRPISVTYAYKKDAKGERHGSAAERILAMQNPLAQHERPHQKFSDAPPVSTSSAPPVRMPFPPTASFNPSMPFVPPPPIKMDASGMPMYPVPPPGGHMAGPMYQMGGMPPMHPFPFPPDMRMSMPPLPPQ
ncbi:hypothetical protein HZS_769 [Henneguya salminicola]|nr:hypothetical protein HZS_769 [Henneguya salminicola]